jgi:uncharacterized protein YceK
MKRIVVLSIVSLLVVTGCSSAELAQVRAGEQAAEQVYAATTQATAAAKNVLAALPPSTPGYAAATQVVGAAEKTEQMAQLALDVAHTALAAVEKKDAAGPALLTSLSAALAAIPSPWSAALAALLPAAIPLVISVLQSFKLGQAHQTVAQVTQQLDEHRAALAAMSAKADVATAIAVPNA